MGELDITAAKTCPNIKNHTNARTDLPAALEALEEAQGREDKVLDALAEALGAAATTPARTDSPAKYVRILAEERDEAQGKLEELERLTYDLHQRSGHPDSACLRCQFYAILRGTEEAS